MKTLIVLVVLCSVTAILAAPKDEGKHHGPQPGPKPKPEPRPGPNPIEKKLDIILFKLDEVLKAIERLPHPPPPPPPTTTVAPTTAEPTTAAPATTSV
uniref:Uncharacterized protein n=1 Tax=Tetranychus urticae TaxID=32264 RepID=T1K142_TETUR